MLQVVDKVFHVFTTNQCLEDRWLECSLVKSRDESRPGVRPLILVPGSSTKESGFEICTTRSYGYIEPKREFAKQVSITGASRAESMGIPNMTSKSFYSVVMACE